MITDFNKKQKNLDLLKANITVVNNNLNGNKKQFEIHSKTQNEHLEIISKCETESAQLKTERIGFLPIDITVESKRKSLQSLSNQLGEKVESSKKNLQKLLDSKTEKEAEKLKTIKCKRI